MKVHKVLDGHDAEHNLQAEESVGMTLDVVGRLDDEDHPEPAHQDDFDDHQNPATCGTCITFIISQMQLGLSVARRFSSS